MAHPLQDSSICDAVELLKDNGFDRLAPVVTVLMNTAMVAERSEYLGARSYERSESRNGHANGFKDKTLKTRLRALSLKVPQTRDCDFYPRSMEKGLRSERAFTAECGQVCDLSITKDPSGGGHPRDIYCAGSA